MVDSDDEYDKKIRDKFRGERTESVRGIDRRDDRRPRDDWIERDGWNSRSRGRGDYRNSLRDKYSPVRHEPPPVKRMRTEWDERRYYDAASAANYSYGAWLSAESQAPTTTRTVANVSSSTDANIDTQPPMMSLKAFLNTQDDMISDEEALKKYNEYKMEFRRQQLNEFFLAHKDEEWFKDKYHPVNSKKRKEEHLSSVKKRLSVFLDFYEKDKIDGIMVDADQSIKLINLMDAFVIFLEGGDESDLSILEDNSSAVKPFNSTDHNKLENKHTNSELPKPIAAGTSEKGKENVNVLDSSTSDTEVNDQTVTTTHDDKTEKIVKEETDQNNVDTVNEQSNDKIIDTISLIKDGESDEDDKNLVKKTAPRPLHRTSSLFLRNLVPTITKDDIENIVKKFKGYLRVALADPQMDKRWARRGWITFERDVDIKDICWRISNIRIKDNELNPIVNRDLSRRIRTVSSITTNKRVLRNDMKLCVQIITNLDKKYNLWNENPSDEDPYSVQSKNPVLQNITSYLIEEASAEEEALLGENEVVEEVDETDPNVFQALDRMILYLRMTYSIDYYNHCEYPNEDEMPNRCGIIHARITSPNTKVSAEEVSEYCKSFKSKCQHLLELENDLNEEQIIELGRKNADVEVEKFIAANTQELAPEKWLCPLSGKKFKGPEFVLKHIQNKHADKIEEVRLECEYFNNYLKDPKRPQLMEHPGNKSINKSAPEPPATTSVLAQSHPSPYQYGFGATTGLYTGGYGRGNVYGYPRSPRIPYNNRRGGGDFRPIANYRDLDAPKEVDEFA